MASNNYRTQPTFIDGRAIFVHLKEPRTKEGSDRATFEICLLIQKKDKKAVAAVEDLIFEAIDGQFPNGEPKRWWNPLRDADSEEDREDGAPLSENYPEAEGCYYVNFSSSFFNWTSGIVDQRARAVKNPDIIYPGCYVKVYADAYAYDNKKKGVGLGLLAVQLTGEGEQIASSGGGAVKAASVFSAVDSDDEDERPARSRRRGRDEEDDDEDERPAPRRRGRAEEDDDEDERPAPRRRRGRDEEDEEDERPAPRRRR